MQMKQTTFLVLILLSLNINAQTFLELFSTENSNISENDLKSILVDKKTNNKLIGTSKSGLLKYDNVKFEKIQQVKGDYFGPLFKDKNENIWATSSNPEELYLIKSNSEIEKITSLILKEIDGVIAISEDKQGNIYFGGKGLVKFDGRNWSKVKLPNNSITIRTLDTSADNTIAIGHNSGLIIGKENNWKSFDEETDKLQLSTVRAVKFLNDNKLFIGYGGGFGNGGFSVKEGEIWTHFNKSNSKISDHMVRDIEIDTNNTLWMATNNGLVKFTEKGELTSILFREGMYKNTILDISIDNDNVLWIATNFGVIKFKE
jgi:ligand-binding sensor domain-containing protein